MILPNRHDNTPAYRYGFQGQEKDDEVKGEGNSLNYTFRMYDPRVGRFFATDPLDGKFPYLSPYQFASNSPIMAIELEGLESSKTDTNKNEKPEHGEQSSDGTKIFITNNDKRENGMWIPEPSQEYVEKMEKQIKEGIKSANKKGAKRAAYNLAYWFVGSGETLTFDKGIRRTKVFKNAKEENITRFLYTTNSNGESLYKIWEGMKNGETRNFSDYWESQITFDPLGSSADYYYAWGTINLKTSGEFLLKKDSNGVLKITGEFTHEIMDDYNWNPGGQTILVTDGMLPRRVNDNDLLILEVCGSACSFEGYDKFSEEGVFTLDEKGKTNGWSIEPKKE